jgi:hypothetical protein
VPAEAAGSGAVGGAGGAGGASCGPFSSGEFEEPRPNGSVGGAQHIVVSVLASTDDAEERVGSTAVDVLSSDLELVRDEYEHRGDQLIGIRFANLPIPRGAIVHEARLYGRVDDDGDDSECTALQIQVEDAGDARTFRAAPGDISGRPRRAESVSWFPRPWKPRLTVRTPDLSRLVHGIINRPDWNEGNAIVFVISGEGRRVIEAFDSRADELPSVPSRLEVFFK